ncbi:hypothetical protein [Roseobacter sp.]|uniref:hypothetical protein n=1 Tax=Roseobacter sp. TaxID=1907202 RepID=UPI003297701A
MSDYAQFEKRAAETVANRGAAARLKRQERRITPRMILVGVAGFLVFKSLIMVVVGIGTYDGRVADLQAGRGWEQLVAWIMQPGVVSGALAETFAKFTP